MITVLDSQNFESEITNSLSPIIVDFFASWCGPCKMLSPVLEKIDEKFENVYDNNDFINMNIEFRQQTNDFNEFFRKKKTLYT